MGGLKVERREPKSFLSGSVTEKAALKKRTHRTAGSTEVQLTTNSLHWSETEISWILIPIRVQTSDGAGIVVQLVRGFEFAPPGRAISKYFIATGGNATLFAVRWNFSIFEIPQSSCRSLAGALSA